MMRAFIAKILGRTHAYKRCFKDLEGELTPEGLRVMQDLARFCRAHQPTTMVSPITRTVDPIASAQADGRREVYLRILWHLGIDDADLINFKESESD